MNLTNFLSCCIPRSLKLDVYQRFQRSNIGKILGNDKTAVKEHNSSIKIYFKEFHKNRNFNFSEMRKETELDAKFFKWHPTIFVKKKFQSIKRMKILSMKSHGLINRVKFITLNSFTVFKL